MGLLADLLSDSTQAILFKAQDYADSRKETLNTAHVIKAMFDIKGTTAFDLLRSTGLKTVSLIKYAKNNEGRNEISELVERSAKIARNYEFSFVEPEHLLFVILKNDHFLGYKIIHSNQIDINHLIGRISEWLYGISILRSITNKPNHEVGVSEKQAVVPNDIPIPKATLDSFAINLSQKAKEGLLDPVVDRNDELQNIINTLLRRNKNNVLLIGDPGIGKTALAHGLATAIMKGNVPVNLKHKLIYELSVSSLVAGTMYRGQFEERVKDLLDDIKNRGNVILFIDEIHTLNGTGSTEGTLDLANILKPALTRGEVSIIGATTYEEYNKYFAQDKALERRFQNIVLSEPNDQSTFQMVKSLAKNFESHHRTKILTDSIKRAIELSNKYMPNRFQPDKTIDLIDEACSNIQTKIKISAEEKDLQKKLTKVIDKKIKLINKGQLELALRIKDQEVKLIKQLSQLQKKKGTTLSVKDIENIVSLKTNIPLSVIQQDLVGKEALENNLKKKIFGQDKAINIVSRAIARANLGFKKNQRPVASFLFVGPTGVGKSELAKILAQTAYAHTDSLIKLDMSEYSQKHTVSQLIGSPKGYIGYEEGGSLTSQIRKQPYSVVLFDEIEKAHPEVFNILLQVLEDGVLTDNHNQKSYFNHAIIILTSNLGSEKFNQNNLGFVAKNGKFNLEIKNIVKDFIKPELLSRLSDIIYFNPLSKSAINKITRQRLAETKNNLRKRGVRIKISGKVTTWLNKFYNPQKGARSIDEIVTTKFEDNLVETLFNSKDAKNLEANIDKEELKISRL